MKIDVIVKELLWNSLMEINEIRMPNVWRRFFSDFFCLGSVSPLSLILFGFLLFIIEFRIVFQDFLPPEIKAVITGHERFFSGNATKK